MFYPQSNVYPQGFNSQAPNQPFNLQGLNPLASSGQIGQIPFANTLYGFPQPSPYSQQFPIVAQQLPLFAQGHSQYPAQYPNWQQAQQQQPHQHLLHQLAQYHSLIAHQLSQLAAQQAFQPGNGAFGSGQFIPGQLGSNYQPGSNYLPGTMH
jgi:hypothetical protein